MAQEFRIVFLLLLACLLVIEGHISVPEVEGIEAMVIEIPPGGLPLSLLRNKREDFDNASHVGVTARLSNDNHSVAVVHWSGYPSEVIFVLTKQTVGGLYGTTKESFLWRSTDYGRTFINETNKFPPNAVAHWYHISKDSNKVVFRDIVNSRLYVTTDEGESYKTYEMDFQPRDNIYFSYSNLSNPDYVYTMDTSTAKLYVSTNLGMNWTLIGTGVGAAYWTYLKSGQNRSFDDPSTIYFTLGNTGRYRLMKAHYPYQNSTREFDDNLGDIKHFAAHYEYLFAVKNDSSTSSLFVSYNRRPFAQAHFPLSLEQRHYAVVDASEGEVLLAVYHNENLNLYISDETGIYYSLTLENVITNDEIYWNASKEKFDVHVVKGIKGTYIANVEVEGGLYGASVISFDKGAEWKPLTAPTLDHNGVPLNCFPPNCSLHLHMNSSTLYGFSDILSKKTAIGLIMAQGNTGTSLHRSSYYDTKLYFSHDGGFSWQELFRYNHVFQFLDHGSIVVAVRLYAYTRVVKFSCDEGVNWHTYNIFDDDDDSDEPDRVYPVGMFTELGEKVVHATIFGLEGFPFKEWLLVDLDFSLLNISVCNESQYTTWVPTDERLGRRCLLGERIVYEKRVSGECCINGPDYEIPVGRSTCQCAIEDFECDFNFERINIDAPCIPVRGYDPYAVPSDCSEGANYNISSGYRRIAGDKCTIDETAEDNYFLSETIPCPVRAPEGLRIIQEVRVFGANRSMQFELVQVIGGKLHTHYTWSWGDHTQNITVTGYDDNRYQTHNYSLPGTYTITVSATNEGGSASVTKDVTVLDFIENVIMNGPLTGAVHTELSYRIEVTSKFGTNYTGPITYSWDFKDGTSSTGIAVSHTYHDANNYAIKYTANNPVGSNVNITTVLIEEIVQDVEIVIEPKISAVNQTVAFSVTMKKSDFYGSISYGYEFGDNSNRSEAISVSHTYAIPGNYLARVSLQNLAGVVSVTNNVYIQDKISNVTIPSLHGNSSLVAIVNAEVVFRAIITSAAGTNYYTPVTYLWDFGDSNAEMTTDPSITHSYSAPGSWNVSLTAKNNVSSATFSGQIKVSKAVSHVSINGTNIVSVSSNVTFSINLLRKDEVLPSDTMYTWSVSSHIAGTNNISGTNLAQYSKVFSTAGTYEVAVLGVYSSGSFTASFTIIVRNKIGDIDIVVDPVIEVNKEAVLFVHLSDTNRAVYSGSLNITFSLSNNISDVSYFESAPQRISHRLLYQYAGTYTVQVIAENEVSILNRSIPIEVVSTNVSVIISFNASTLKSADINYRDSIWIDQFVALVDDQLTNELQLPQWQLVGMVVGIRDDNYDENYFRIQLDILPETLQVQDLGKATDIANQLIQHVSSKGYYLLSPHNINLNISDAEIKVPSTIFVHNETESLTSSSSKKLAIELGVAGGVALLVAIVLCVVGIAYYRRKYHHLEVQYSRLRQSDVVHFNVMEDTSCGESSSPTKTDVDSVDQSNDDL